MLGVYGLVGGDLDGGNFPDVDAFPAGEGGGLVAAGHGDGDGDAVVDVGVGVGDRLAAGIHAVADSHGNRVRVRDRLEVERGLRLDLAGGSVDREERRRRRRK